LPRGKGYIQNFVDIFLGIEGGGKVLVAAGIHGGIDPQLAELGEGAVKKKNRYADNCRKNNDNEAAFSPGFFQ
jgi:hypothetical protein